MDWKSGEPESLPDFIGHPLLSYRCSFKPSRMIVIAHRTRFQIQPIKLQQDCFWAHTSEDRMANDSLVAALKVGVREREREREREARERETRERYRERKRERYSYDYCSFQEKFATSKPGAGGMAAPAAATKRAAKTPQIIMDGKQLQALCQSFSLHFSLVSALSHVSSKSHSLLVESTLRLSLRICFIMLWSSRDCNFPFILLEFTL